MVGSLGGPQFEGGHVGALDRLERCATGLGIELIDGRRLQMFRFRALRGALHRIDSVHAGADPTGQTVVGGGHVHYPTHRGARASLTPQ